MSFNKLITSSLILTAVVAFIFGWRNYNLPNEQQKNVPMASESIQKESLPATNNPDIEESFRLLLEKCDHGDIDACNEGWDTYYNFDDVQKAVEFAKIACEHGDVASCTTAGNAYEYAYKLLRYDPKQAYDYYKRACDGRNKNACERLRVFSSEGKTLTHDTQPRQKLLQSQCDKGDTSACTDLGIMYEKGMGLKKDYAVAAKYYRLGCKQPIDRGCEEGSRLGVREYYE